MLGRILLLLCLATVSTARADVTDISPVRCAWSKLPPALQTSLREAFAVDSSSGDRFLVFTLPTRDEAAAATAACALTYDERQMTEFAGALGAKAGEEISRDGVARRGAVAVEVVDDALARMHDGKRRTIGDALSCGGKVIRNEWDRSVIGAMRRAHVRTVDGRTVSLIAIAMYATFMQEGYMRRIAGTAAPCDEFKSGDRDRPPPDARA